MVEVVLGWTARRTGQRTVLLGLVRGDPPITEHAHEREAHCRLAGHGVWPAVRYWVRVQAVIATSALIVRMVSRIGVFVEDDR